MKRHVVLSLVTLIVASTTLTACNSNSNPNPNASPNTIITSSPQAIDSGLNSITVNSTEEMSVVPDMAEVVYAVTTQQKDAATCQAKNSEDITKVIELLKELGVAETSIQTSDYYMQPLYNNTGTTQKISSYQATTTLTVSDLPIDNLGDILTKSVSSGINTVQSIRYSSSKYDENYQEALSLAVVSAKAKAEALANAGSCVLGGVLSIQENSNYSQARYTDNSLVNKMAAKEELLADTAPVDIMPGEIKVSVDITVQYQIQ